jgi:hypothetical protein
MLLLAPPSTRPPDAGVTIVGPPDSARQVARAALANGCPRTVADRVESCIRHSGRYDCRISTTLSHPMFFEPFLAELRLHGADARLTDPVPADAPGSTIHNKDAAR